MEAYKDAYPTRTYIRPNSEIAMSRQFLLLLTDSSKSEYLGKEIVPDMGVGRYLGPERNGVSLGRGGEGGPGPPRNEGDKQSVLNKSGDNMDKDEEEQASRA